MEIEWYKTREFIVLGVCALILAGIVLVFALAFIPPRKDAKPRLWERNVLPDNPRPATFVPSAVFDFYFLLMILFFLGAAVLAVIRYFF